MILETIAVVACLLLISKYDVCLTCMSFVFAFCYTLKLRAICRCRQVQRAQEQSGEEGEKMQMHAMLSPGHKAFNGIRSIGVGRWHLLARDNNHYGNVASRRC